MATTLQLLFRLLQYQNTDRQETSLGRGTGVMRKDGWFIVKGSPYLRFLMGIVLPVLERSDPNSLQTLRRTPHLYNGSFAMREKGSSRLVPGRDYIVDALKLPNQVPRGSDESLQKCVAWRCPDGTQLLFC
ncbi:hypothetical protein TNCV_1788011 [Trichonephila clavipes]|nr:hypothetical protein TNCV_1788011 [Trichonephila clavipes]